MNLKSFLWDKLLAIVFNTVGIITVTVYICLIADLKEAVIVAAVWSFILTVYCLVSYLIQKKRIERIKQKAMETEDKFLLSEIVETPLRIEDRLYYELMQLQGRAAIERVIRAEKEKADYYDYIEQWVHEIKTPIAAIGLICGNNQGADFSEIAVQTDKINNYAEQVLFEAKSNNTEKDLMIKEVDLSLIINTCIKENRRLFINSGVEIDVDVSGFVFSDSKWLEFIIKQILYNSVQYSKDKGVKTKGIKSRSKLWIRRPSVSLPVAESRNSKPFVRLSRSVMPVHARLRTLASLAAIKIQSTFLNTEELELSIWDNGIGILESELSRIFDKGFTGSNGRRNKKSTGLGLYLCKKLCNALDITINAQSAVNEYTRITLVFRCKNFKPQQI